MEEEVNQRVVSLSFNAGRMTAEVAARAMAGFIAAEHQKMNQHAAERSSQPKHGKIKFEQLMDMDAGADRMELEKSGLRTFDRVARKGWTTFAEMQAERKSVEAQYVQLDNSGADMRNRMDYL